MAVSAPAALAAPPNVVEHCLKYEAHGQDLFDKTVDRDLDKGIEFYEKGVDKLGACLDKF